MMSDNTVIGLNPVFTEEYTYDDVNYANSLQMTYTRNNSDIHDKILDDQYANRNLQGVNIPVKTRYYNSKKSDRLA